ncbi:MAG: putative toxin-antitoxin system toxin component, PIN family [Caloramator sp.]|nr:putative toxin-antitoxin system toxin component, PIN family [Caloramator sp.]
MIRAVIDTNVLVSALLTSNGAPAKVLNHVILGNVVVCYDSNIMSEYREVLARPKFNFDQKLVKRIIDFIELKGISIIPQPLSVEFEDEDDKIFYEVAMSADANLVTGNKKHFPNNTIVVTPQEFLNIIEEHLG